MKAFSKFSAILLTVLALAGTSAHAQDKPKGWSGKAKGAAIGGGAGAVVGGLVGGGKGALIGAGAGLLGGGAIGKHQDKKNDPARYNRYVNNKAKQVPVR